MKKLVSMLLALVLCLCGMTSAMAETTVETFPYTLEEYKMYFDVLSSNLFGVVPVWTISEEDDAAVAVIESWGVAVLMLDEAGRITGLVTTTDISMESDVETESNKFGQMVALTALSSLAAEDVDSFTDEKVNAFSAALMTMITSLTGSIAQAMTEPVTVSEELNGNLCTFVMSLDLEAMTMSFGFLMEP